ncbi:hypothetical protein BH23DEI1_BH23DEI1_09010 [soil metagenome]|nr:hypothetical protein [Trueperaceae bacterium]
MKGSTITLSGDRWTVVDVAPAAPLAEMVAALLEEEGFVAQTRGADALTHLGTFTAGVTLVVVPEAQGEAALALIAETVTDYEGEELDEVLARLALDPGALGSDDPFIEGDDELASLDGLDGDADSEDDLRSLDED